MKLKRLQLQGYKTFASRTDFDFNSGITAIVGPNGSGKSNVADAIRWVLGEQSYSALRGKRTVDMIFAGSQTRSRAGMAQASLTLDNSDGWLPIDYTEVEIGRRAFRSGENEYLLNGQKVRLRDVHDLLATSGLAERTYTIIGQGLIDQALSLRAEERRALFEEAAGVSHYQARRAQTLRQLEETQRNLERVHDILSEIRPRLGTLKRQARRARTYGQVEADLRQLLRVWYGYQWEQKKRVLREQRQVADDAEARWKEGRRQLSEHQDDIDARRQQISELQEEISRRRSAREELREQREQARRQVAVLSERRTSLERQLADVQEELPGLEEQHAVAQEALAEAMAELETAQARLRQQQEELARFNQSFETKQLEINKWSARVNRLEKEQRGRQKELAQAEGKLAQLRERLQERQSQPDSAAPLAAAAAEVTKLERLLEAAGEKVAELNEQRKTVQREQNKARRILKNVQQEQREGDRSLNKLAEEVARLEARCELLDQMRQRELHVNEEVSLIGRLAQFIQIPTEHQRALEAALGSRLNTLILAHEEDLWALVKANGQQDVLFAAAVSSIGTATLHTTPAADGVLGWANDYIETEDQIEPLVRLLFAPVLLVTSREVAFALADRLPPNTLAVAPDGFIVHAGGLVELRAAHDRQSVLAREKAWREVQEQLAKQNGLVTRAKSQLESKQQAVADAQKALKELDNEDRRLGRLLHEANQRQTRAQRDLDRAKQQRDFLEQQRHQQNREVERLGQRIVEVQTLLQEQQSEVVRLESAVGDARIRLEALPVAEAEQQRQSQKQEIETARTIVAGRQAVVESRRATLQQIEGQLRRHRERIGRFQQEKAQLELDSAQQRLNGLQASVQQLDGDLEPLLSRLQKLQSGVRSLEGHLLEWQRKTHDLETHYTQMKVSLSQRENQLEGLVERIRADLGLVLLEFDEEQGGQTPLPMSEVVERLPRVDELPDKIEQQIQESRGQLHRIGSVNPDAPLEYAETQERYDFLTQQVEDLNHTEKRLRKVIAELDELTSQAFAATVRKVDSIFGELFERLFGGGSAQLVLTEPDDLTISGVDIVCRLPSRRQQRLGLLSGGERSLTATALIFALLKVSPPPFCVLDEVDAMLDEANVTRFREVLERLSDNSQFIVITHNRGTVQVAQTVYGISMGTDSASQVLSVRPEEFVNGGE